MGWCPWGISPKVLKLMFFWLNGMLIESELYCRSCVCLLCKFATELTTLTALWKGCLVAGLCTVAVTIVLLHKTPFTHQSGVLVVMLLLLLQFTYSFTVYCLWHLPLSVQVLCVPRLPIVSAWAVVWILPRCWVCLCFIRSAYIFSMLAGTYPVCV